MKERPIIFNGDMVRAVLEGRKTQTRRPVKPQPSVRAARFVPHFRDAGKWEPETNSGKSTLGRGWESIRCPYGQPGDRLWVRETFEESSLPGHVFYRADYASDPKDDHAHGVFWRPSIHMPREFSRLTLEITVVRVERLQEITEADAQAEGATPWHDTSPNGATVYVPEFRFAWDSIYAKRGMGWDDNPWVWAITFKIAQLSLGV